MHGPINFKQTWAHAFFAGRREMAIETMDVSWVKYYDVSKNQFWKIAWEIKILLGSCLTVQSFPGIWNLRIVRSAKLTRMKFVVRCIRSRRRMMIGVQIFLGIVLLKYNICFKKQKSLGWLVEILFFFVLLNVSRNYYEMFAKYSF